MRLIILLLILISTAHGSDFTTYIGGANLDQSLSVAASAVDAAGDTYVTGTQVTETASANIAASNVFVTKLGPAGNILFTTAFGQNYTVGSAIAVDPAGNVWVGGFTGSQNFPLLNALQSTPSSVGPWSGILVKMAPDGTVLYSSYFGGVMGSTTVNGLATDPNGNVYVTGSTSSSDFPTTPGLPASSVSATVLGAFVTKLDATGQKIIYSTVIAATTPNCPSICEQEPSTDGTGISVDGAGNAMVAGNTNTIDLPVTIGSSSNSGAFALKINAAGNDLVYLTYIGPTVAVINDVRTSSSLGTRPISVDASGNAYLVGSTNSPEFPATRGAYQTTYNAGANLEAFAMKLNPAGAMIWATLLGGSGGSMANAISLDSSNNVWLTGTNGPGFPGTPQGSSFVSELSNDGAALLYSAGFPADGVGQDIAVDESGVIHVAGSANLMSTITPGNSAARVLSILNAASGTTVGLVAPGELISIYGVGLGPATPLGATPENGFFPKSLGGVQVLVDGSPVPLLYVSATQINAEIPSPLSGIESGTAVIQAMNNSVALPDFRVAVATSFLGMFENPIVGSLAVINQDGTLNSPTNPAKVGSYVSIYATGYGSVPGVVMDGAVATAAINYCASCQVSIVGYNFDIAETVQYIGPSPGLIDGLVQMNFRIPPQIMNVPNLGNTVQVYFALPGLAQTALLGFVQVSP